MCDIRLDFPFLEPQVNMTRCVYDSSMRNEASGCTVEAVRWSFNAINICSFEIIVMLTTQTNSINHMPTQKKLLMTPTGWKTCDFKNSNGKQKSSFSGFTITLQLICFLILTSKYIEGKTGEYRKITEIF